MIHIDSHAVMTACRPVELVHALATGFASDIVAPARSHHTLTGMDTSATLLVMPAWQRYGRIGVKLVTVFPDNARIGQPTVNGIYVIMNREGVVALLDGRMLTLVRTAAVSALASSLLARADAQTLLIVGTGALAPHLVRAHVAVRPIRQILVWGRSIEKAEALAADLIKENYPAQALGDLRSAVQQADVVSCATLSTQPLVHGQWLRPGTHVDLVGGFTPAMREADDDAIRIAKVVVDTQAALHEAGDLVAPLSSGALQRERVEDLRSVILQDSVPMRDRDTITLFKSVGTALADYVVAGMISERLRSGSS